MHTEKYFLNYLSVFYSSTSENFNSETCTVLKMGKNEGQANK